MRLLCGVHLPLKSGRGAITLLPPGHRVFACPLAIPPHNAANHPPARPRLMRATLERVGCIGLFGGDPTLRIRGAHNHRDSLTPPVTREPNHAPCATQLFCSRAGLGPQTFDLRVALPAAERRQSRAPARNEHERHAPWASRALACSGATPRRRNAERATSATGQQRINRRNLTTPRSPCATFFCCENPSHETLGFQFRHQPPNARHHPRPYERT